MNDTAERKSSFDARKSYLDVMEKILSEEKIASLQGEPVAWSQALLTLLSMCWAYVDREERQKILEDLTRIQNRAMSLPANSRMRSILTPQLNQELRRNEYKIHDLAASLMLPTSTDEERGFESDEFARGSDL
jgi:hypothetical protein